MAKPFAERLAGARTNNRVTITDIRALIEEATAERDSHLARSKRADVESVDIMLAEHDRDEAAALADRCRRVAAGFDKALAELAEKLAERLETDRQRDLVVEMEAAIAERDALVIRWQETWPRVMGELVKLFRDTRANEARLSDTRELRNEGSAEAVARGLGPNFNTSFGWEAPLTQMKLPSLAGVRYWPPHSGMYDPAGGSPAEQAALWAAAGVPVPDTAE